MYCLCAYLSSKDFDKSFSVVLNLVNNIIVTCYPTNDLSNNQNVYKIPLQNHSQNILVFYYLTPGILGIR